jgi:peroxiredoxin (alkyl hydroperoxide reductase subunit C)
VTQFKKRNVDEILRVVDALQFTEEHGEVCPAGWHKGDAGMTPTVEGVSTYLSKHGKNSNKDYKVGL